MGEILWFYGLVFVFGLFFGSFLNVVIDRLPKGQSIVYPPSHCPHCKHRLVFYDLIPLFSFFYLNGKCRYCKAKISWYYPMIEAVTGVLFVTTFFVSGLSLADVLSAHIFLLVYLLFIISCLVIVFFTDLKFGIIPFKIVVLALAIISIRYFFLSFGEPGYILGYLFSGIGVFSLFLLLFLVTRGRGIGFGDVVFSLLMGYVLGFPKIVLGVYISFLTGALISLILVLAKRKKLKGGIIPFGPFLVSATIVSLFWGQMIIDKLFLYLHVY